MVRARPHVVAVIIGMYLALVPHPSAAEPQAAALNWVRLPGAESCIAPRDLAIQVEERLGGAVFVPAPKAEMLIEARVEPTPRGFAANLFMTDPHGKQLGRRTLNHDGSCADFSKQLVLVIALTIDPDAELDGDAPKRLPAVAPPTEGGCKNECPPPPPPRIVERVVVQAPEPPPPQVPWRFDVGAGPSLTVGMLPGFTPGVLVRGIVEPPLGLAFELAGHAWFQRETATDGQGALFSQQGVDLGACPTVGRQPRLSVCAGIGGGTIHASGFGFDQTERKSEFILWTYLGPRVRYDLSPRFWLGIGVDGVSPLLRPRFTYTEANGSERELYRPPVVGARGDLNLGLRLAP